MADIKSEENQQKKYINTRVIIEESNNSAEQLVQNIDISECLDQSNNLYLRKFILLLKQDYNFSLQNKQISYFLSVGELWVNCGIDPISQQARIRQQDWEGQELSIRGKQLGVSLVHRLMSFENLNTGQEKDRTCADQMAQRSKCRRTKQRRIGHIIDKVIQWRKFYSGVINQKNQQIKYSLQDAAREAKISKKSLDDYLFQIKFGHKYGFNFNQHYNDKVGVLRDFVRQRKKTDKTDIKNKKNLQRQFERQEDD